jgi:hypothetical protein
MRNHRNRFLAALTLTVALLTAAMAEAGGYYYEFVSYGKSQQQMMEEQEDGQEMRVKGWVDGDSARVEFYPGETIGPFGQGTYLITTDGGETVYLINPQNETYAEFEMEQMMAMMGQVTQMMGQMGGMFKIRFENVHSEKVLEEPGGQLLGRSTTHYRINSGYTTSIKLMGMKQQNTVESVQDIWTTSDFDARGFGVWLRPDRNMKTGNEEFDKLINTELAELEGVPLKTVVVSTTTSTQGVASEQTFTNEVTELREESVPASKFEWPSDYTETQFIPEMAGMKGDKAGGKKKKRGGLSGLLKPDGR